MLFSVRLLPNCSIFRADSWRGWHRAALLALLASLTMARTVSAEDVAVPVSLQAELLAKVAEYDRSFPARAGERVHVLIVAKEANPDSARVVSTTRTALGRRDHNAGLPPDQQIVVYNHAHDLAS